MWVTPKLWELEKAPPRRGEYKSKDLGLFHGTRYKLPALIQAVLDPITPVNDGQERHIWGS